MRLRTPGRVVMGSECDLLGKHHVIIVISAAPVWLPRAEGGEEGAEPLLMVVTSVVRRCSAPGCAPAFTCAAGCGRPTT